MGARHLFVLPTPIALIASGSISLAIRVALEELNVFRCSFPFRGGFRSQQRSSRVQNES